MTVRGEDEQTGAFFSYVDLEARIRQDHPLRLGIISDGLGRPGQRLKELLAPGQLQPPAR